jgi:hypothetical protein
LEQISFDTTPARVDLIIDKSKNKPQMQEFQTSSLLKGA